MIEFALTNHADQKLATIINNNRVSIRFRYNPSIDRWTFDISIDGEAVLHGRRIVTGVDLIAPFGFGIGRIFADSPTGAEPTRDNLINGTVKLYAATEEEISAAVA